MNEASLRIRSGCLSEIVTETDRKLVYTHTIQKICKRKLKFSRKEIHKERKERERKREKKRKI